MRKKKHPSLLRNGKSLKNHQSRRELLNIECQLIQRLRCGESQAVAEWFNLYQLKLAKFVSSKISSSKDAEEVVQEIFLNCMKNFNLFRADSSLWTWMCGVARHEIADYYRKLYAKKTLKTLPLIEYIVPQMQNLDDSHAISSKVTNILKNMSRRYQELLLLKYVDGKTVKAISVEYNKTIKSIESDLFRARVQFRTLWLNEGEE